MKIEIAQNWKQLSEWQLSEIAHLFAMLENPEDFPECFQKMLFILFQNDGTPADQKKMYDILENYLIEDLATFGKFLIETTTLHHFPEIEGLTKPADRLANISAKHFAAADRLFHDYEEARTNKQQPNQNSEIYLRRFVASLYTYGKFNALELPKIAEITDQLTEKQRERIALAYRFCRLHIWDSYPVIFPKPNPEEKKEEFGPDFTKKPQYRSFDKIIMALVFHENQPIGNKHEADETLIYDFMNVLTESILRFKEKEKNAKRN